VFHCQCVQQRERISRARTAEATVLAGCIRALNPCAVQDYRGSFPSKEAALQGWLKPAQPKTWPKDGDGDIIWNGPASWVKQFRTKPGDISLTCAPLYPSLRLPPPFPDSPAPPRPIRLSDTASAGVGWLALQHRLYQSHLGDAKAIELFKRLPSLAGAHLVFLKCVPPLPRPICTGR
jgi:hypothetical protein